MIGWIAPKKISSGDLATRSRFRQVITLMSDNAQRIRSAIPPDTVALTGHLRSGARARPPRWRARSG